tara:strand:- start:242 stop:490 length:249 start_codon:yes stop_codon:yes gene_type:complete
MKTKMLTRKNLQEMRELKLFSNSEALTYNSINKLNIDNITLNQYKIINKIVWDVCNQLEKNAALKNHKIKINDTYSFCVLLK